MLACIASVSARVRRESWDESKKKKKGMRGEGEGSEERDWGKNATEDLKSSFKVTPRYICVQKHQPKLSESGEQSRKQDIEIFNKPFGKYCCSTR